MKLTVREPAPQPVANPSSVPAAKKPREIAVRDIDRESYGEAMQQCSPQERSFVLAVLDGKSFAEAARMAGYGKPESTAQTMASIGHRISHYPRVIDGLLEESRKAIRTTVPQAVQAVREIIADKYHRDRAKVSLNILEKIDPTVQRQDINVRHEVVNHDAEAVTQLRALKALNVVREKLEEVFGYSGLMKYERMMEAQDKAKVIDADFSVVPSGNGASNE